jgi:hypothetical protein
VPDAGIVAALEGMGFSVQHARAAAAATFNTSTEEAMEWCLSNPAPEPAAAAAAAVRPPASAVAPMVMAGAPPGAVAVPAAAPPMFGAPPGAVPLPQPAPEATEPAAAQWEQLPTNLEGQLLPVFPGDAQPAAALAPAAPPPAASSAGTSADAWDALGFGPPSTPAAPAPAPLSLPPGAQPIVGPGGASLLSSSGASPPPSSAAAAAAAAPAQQLAPPSAADYLARLKAEQDTALLMQANPADQRALAARAAAADTEAAPLPPPPAYQPPQPQPQPNAEYLTAAVTPPVTAAGSVSAGDVQALESLGFSAEQARAALHSHNGNVEQAANWLFSQ